MGYHFATQQDEYYDQIDSIIYIDAEGFVRINTKTKEVIYEENAENVKEKQLYQMVKNGDQQFYHIVDRTLNRRQLCNLFCVACYDL